MYFLIRCYKSVQNVFGYIYDQILFFVLYLRYFLAKKHELPDSTQFESSCEVETIVMKKKQFLLGEASPNDFFTIHERTVHPRYVLQEHVSLYCITKDVAYFTETDSNVDIYKMETSPFQYLAQYKHSKKLIAMPPASFHRLAKSIGDPEIDFIYIANVGRCGSTLVAEALENVPGTLMHAEPDSLTNLATLWKSGVLEQEQYEQFLVATIRLLGRTLNPGISRVCVKVRSIAVCHVEAIRKYFPKTKFVFNYRNGLKNVESCHRAVCRDFFRTLTTFIMDNDVISSWFPYFRKSFCAALVQNHPDFNPSELNSTEIYALSWALCMDVMIRFKDNGGDFFPVLYEDLIDDKVSVINRLFKQLGIDPKHVDEALEAFNNDSQDKTPISHSNLKAAAQRKIPREHIRRANVILKKMSLPDLHETFVF